MRLNEVTPAQRRLITDLASRISERLEAHFVELPEADDARIGVALHEGNRKVVIDVPVSLLIEAGDDPTAREQLRIRLKGRRDRLMFKMPPPSLPKKIAPLFSPGPPRAGGGGFRGGRR
jgi:hypothetical protein